MSILSPWQRTAAGANLLSADNQLGVTIFEEITTLANRHGAINLGQGFPDTEGPAAIAEIAQRAIADGLNQYAPGSGIADLRTAVAEHQARFRGQDIDPDTEVVITTGATEGIAAAVLAPHFQPDLEQLASVVSDRTRMIILNNPHNPTGTVFGREVLEHIVALATKHDVLILSDEVYEHLTFGVEHIPVSTLEGAAERTLTLSSAGKTFSFTGWKVGWATGPAHLVAALRTVKQFLSYSSGPAFQPAVAAALRLPTDFFTGFAADLGARGEILATGLENAGMRVYRPQGTYFIVADVAPLGFADAAVLARSMPELIGVAGIPLSVFCHPEGAERTRSLMRFAFCKREEVLLEASSRLSRLSGLVGA